MTTNLRPMPTDRLAGWIAASSAEYVQSRMKAGDTREQAEENSARSFQAFFPDGAPAPGHLVNDVVADDEVVGYLWIGPQDPGSTAWWVWNIEIHEQHRGRGFGRAAMQLAEPLAAANGAVTLGLNVFGFNTPARALYESLGYRTTAVQMRKDL